MSKRKKREDREVSKDNEVRMRYLTETNNENINNQSTNQDGIGVDLQEYKDRVLGISKQTISKDGSTENKNGIYIIQGESEENAKEEDKKEANKEDKKNGNNKEENKNEDQKVAIKYKLYPLWSTSTDSFGKYGVGIQLYFKYMKAMIILFSIMTLISIPALVSNLRGNYYTGRNKSQFDFTMFGNQVGFDHEKSTDYNGSSLDQILVISSDLVNTSIFFFFFIVFKYICKKLIVEVLRKTHTVSDYSIYVTGFPLNGINDYLESNKCTELKQSEKYNSKIKVKLEKRIIEEHFSHYGKIEEVVFSRRFGNMMKDYMRQDNLNKEICKLEVKIEIMTNKNRVEVEKRINKPLIKLKQKDNKMEEEIRLKYPNIKSYDDLPLLGAFIVFDDPEACNRCYDDYVTSNKYTYQQRLKLLDMYNMNVQRADEPANINWGNLEVGKCESFWRSSVAIIITIILLICTFIFVFILRTSLDQLSDPDNCQQYVKYTPQTVNRSNETAVDCVCIKAGLSKDISNSEYKDLCKNYVNKYLLRVFITVVVSFLVSTINYFIRITFRMLSSFERFKNLTDEKESVFKKLFISVFINH